MHKFVAGGRTVPVILETSRADNLMAPRESLEQFFNGVRLDVSHRGTNRDRQWKFPEDARDLKDALLFEAQPLDLELNHLP